MKKVTIHRKIGCRYCEMAIEILKSYNIDFTIQNYNPNEPEYEKAKQYLFNYGGMETFPQIYIDEKLLFGGYDKLERTSKSDFLDLIK